MKSQTNQAVVARVGVASRARARARGGSTVGLVGGAHEADAVARPRGEGDVRGEGVAVRLRRRKPPTVSGSGGGEQEERRGHGGGGGGGE